MKNVKVYTFYAQLSFLLLCAVFAERDMQEKVMIKCN